MAKAVETASPAIVRAALKNWGVKRREDRQLLPRKDPEKLIELARLLEVNQEAIGGKIVTALNNDYFLTRLRVKDVLPELHDALTKAYRNRQALDLVRDWFGNISEGRIRVEGDPHSTGYYIEFGEDGEGAFEPHPINHGEVPADTLHAGHPDGP